MANMFAPPGRRRRPGPFGMDATNPNSQAQPFGGAGNYGRPMPMEQGSRNAPFPIPGQGGWNASIPGGVPGQGSGNAPFPIPGQGGVWSGRAPGQTPGWGDAVRPPMGKGNAPFPIPGQGGWTPTPPGGGPGPELAPPQFPTELPPIVPGQEMSGRPPVGMPGIPGGVPGQGQTPPGAFGAGPFSNGVVPGATGSMNLQSQFIDSLPPRQRDPMRQLMAQGIPFDQAYRLTMHG